MPEVVVRRRGIRRDPGRGGEMRRHLLEIAGPRVQQRDVIVQRRVAGIGQQHRLVALDVLEELRRLHPARQRCCGRPDCEAGPETTTRPSRPRFVARISPPWAARSGSAGFAGRVVVGPPHRHRRARRQRHGRHVSVDILPVEVPVLDRQQALDGPVGKRREAFDLPGQVVGVRLDGVHVDVHRQPVRCRDHVMRLSRRDVDVLPGQAEQGGDARRRRIREVQADARLHHFRFAAGTHVQHQHQVALLFHRERHAVGRHVRRVSRSPVEKVPVGRHRRMGDQAFVAWRGILLVQVSRHARRIDLHRRVVNHSQIARTKFPGLDVALCGNRRSAGRSDDTYRRRSARSV